MVGGDWNMTCIFPETVGNGKIIPIDFHTFQRGRLNRQPVLVFPRDEKCTGSSMQQPEFLGERLAKRNPKGSEKVTTRKCQGEENHQCDWTLTSFYYFSEETESYPLFREAFTNTKQLLK